MNPYIMMLLQRLGASPAGQRATEAMNPYIMTPLQRLGSSSLGQRAADVMDRMRNFEATRIPLTRGPSGRYLPATAAQKVPLSPIGSGIAGAGGVELATQGYFSGNVPPGPSGRVPIPAGLIEELNARGAAAPVEGRPVQVMDSTLFGEDVGRRPAPMRISGYDPTLGGGDMPAPAPARRPAPRLENAPMPPRRPDTGAAESILSRIFSGKDYQSNNRPVVEDGRVNWGDSERAADFFRADRAARELGVLPPVERASGGQVGQQGHAKPHKDAALVKALEIIERLMADRR